MLASGASFDPAFRPERVGVGEDLGVLVEEVGHTVDAGLKRTWVRKPFFSFGVFSEN